MYKEAKTVHLQGIASAAAAVATSDTDGPKDKHYKGAFLRYV
jgi:hypothetical protein